MLCLSQTSGYAIRALCCLDRCGGRWVRAWQIAACTGIPKAYLSKTLHALGRCGLIATKRGYQGGFQLARPAGRIRVLDIVEAVEGAAWQPRCLLGMADCSDRRSCPTHEFWKVQRERIRAELARLTLAAVSEFEAAMGNTHTCCAVQSTHEGRIGYTGSVRRRPGSKPVLRPQTVVRREDNRKQKNT